MSPLRRFFIAIQFVAVIACLSGCRTDAIHTDRQEIDAPVTSMERPEGVDLPDLVLVDVREVDLVEAVLSHRANYYRSLIALRNFYRDKGRHRKQLWAEYELADVERIKPFKYILDAEIPVLFLRATDSISEADALYTKGLEVMKQGGHGVPALYREELMREALKTFVELITEYPRSDKIDDAAFYCGEIYKEYFKNQEEIAIQWYERAWTWNPQTPHPVRFQAAVVTDFRLHDRARALELYREVLKYEPDNKSNTSFAVNRIHQLTEDLDSVETRVLSEEASTPPPVEGTALKDG